ncbi:MAG: hypothetical protein AB8H47_15695 [Bacteroidia bacterium]
MQRLFKRLTPNWLQRIDKHLLLNDPILWATRIHHVIFWSVLGLLLAGFYGSYAPVGERHLWLLLGGTGLLGLASLVGFGIWWTTLLRFPAVEQAGRLKGWLSLRNLLLFLLGTSLLSAIPVLYYELLSQRSYEVLFSGFSNILKTSPLASTNHLWQWWLLAGLPLLWLLTDMSAYMRKKQFWMTIAAAIGVTSLLALILEAFGPGRDTALPLFTAMFLVAQIRLLVEWIYEDNPAQERSIWMQVIFLGLSTLHVWVIPTAILLSIQFNLYIEEPSTAAMSQRITWILGAGFAIVMWHRYFRRKVLALYLQPPE